MPNKLITLYTDIELTSPYAMSVFVALHEKGLDFDLQKVDLAASAQDQPDYATKSLTQRVPTLVHEGFALSESSAITEYLDEVFPHAPLYPKEIKQRARARQIQAWLRSDLMPIRSERSALGVFYGEKFPPLSAEAKAAAQQLFFVAGALLDHGGEHLFGNWSIADTDLALMLNRLVIHGDSVPDHLAAFAIRQWQRSSVQLWVNQQRPPL